MMETLEYALVGLIVLGCAGFSVWRLLTVRLRLRLLEVLSVLPRPAGGALVASLRRKTLANVGGGCSACQDGSISAAARSSNRKSA